MNRLQLGGWVEKAFVAPLYIVIHLDAKNICFLSVGNNLVRFISLKPVGANAYVVGPILFNRGWRSCCEQGKEDNGREYDFVQAHGGDPQRAFCFVLYCLSIYFELLRLGSECNTGDRYAKGGARGLGS